MEEHVFGPLGMDSTSVRADPATIIEHASQGYTVSDEWYREAGDLYAAYGAGGIYTTVEDLSEWLGNFSDAGLGGREIIEQMVTPDTLNNGNTLDYGLGIFVEEYRGLKRYSHGGADIAHRASLYYFPEIDAGVAALSNNGMFASGYVADALADVFFKDELEPEEATEEKKDSAAVEVPEKLLKAYAGKYKMTTIGTVLEFTLEEGTLVFQGQPNLEMIPRSDSVFDYKGVEATLAFHLDSTGNVAYAIHTQGETQYELVPVAPYEPSVAELMEFEGRYYSNELQTFYTLEVKDSTLTLMIRNTEEIELDPMEEDNFSGDVFFIDQMNFLRNDQGEVTGFTVSNGRTRGIRFEVVSS
jgi:hypothetical protein